MLTQNKAKVMLKNIQEIQSRNWKCLKVNFWALIGDCWKKRNEGTNQYTEQQTQHRLILCTHLKYHSRFLQQICSHVGTDDTVTVVKADLDVFPKATAVVISGGLCISDGLGKRRQTQPTIITKCVFRGGYADNHNWSAHCKCKESVHLDSGRTPIMLRVLRV